MSKWKFAHNLNQKGLAVTGLTSSTTADDTHTEDNQGTSKFNVQPGNKDKRFYPLGRKTSEAKKEKTMAADIPALVTSKIPVIIPMMPCRSASAMAP